ncbi:MAG: YaeQ family protein [Burkholderiales bacterium]
MALKATIFKAGLQIADTDRNYYRDHALTLARHPSETDERMMVRLLAFALNVGALNVGAPNAGEALAFAKGLGADDEPDLWQKDLTGAIELWIDVGLPDEKTVRKACGRAAQVRIYSYGGHSAELWWNQVRDKLDRAANLTVINLPAASSQAMARLARRNMRLQCTIQDGHVLLTDGQDTAQVEPVTLKAAQFPSR